MLKAYLTVLGIGAVTAASLFVAAPALAMDNSMMMGKIDCSKASEMLSNAQKMGTSTATTGEIDQIVFPTVMDRAKGTNMMLHIEAECGTDPKIKAMAVKAAAESDAQMKKMEMMMPAMGTPAPKM